MAKRRRDASIIDFLRRRLQADKGRWPEISEDSGVPYGTLEKIAQGDTTNCELRTLEKLLKYYGALDMVLARLQIFERVRHG